MTQQTTHTVGIQLRADASQLSAEMAHAEQAMGRLSQGTQAVGAAAEQSSRQLSGMQQAAQTTATSAAPAMQQTAQATQAAANTTARAIGQQTQAMQQGEMSAKQMAQALRMVPMQMTDVFVSIVSGMPVWMVAIQQGGQLKDAFGGIGPAAKAVGGYVLGMINPLTVAGAALLAVGYASYAGAKEQTALAHSLVLTGSQSGATTAQLSNLAQAMGELDGVTRGGATAALTEFVAMNATGVESLQRFTTAAMAFERAGGGSVQDVAKQFKALGDDPLEAALKLNDGINFLTVSTYEQIKSLESQGKKTEAAKVAQEAYAAALEQRTPALLSNLGLIERGWLAIKSATAGAGDAILGIGRARDPLTQVKEELAKLQENQAGARSDNKEKYQPAIDALSRQLLMIDKIATAESERAKSKAEELRLVKDKAEWDKQSAEFVDKRGKRDQELIAAAVKGRELINKGLLTETELKNRLLGITEKYKEAKPKSTANEFVAEQEAAKRWADTLTDLQRIQVDAEAATQNYTKAQQRLLQWFADPLFAKASDAQKELALAAFEAAHAFETEQAAIKRADAVMREAVAAYNQRLDAEYRAAESIAEQLQKQLDHNAAIGQTVTAIAELEGAKLNEQAISKERLGTLADEIDWSGQLGDAYRKQAADLRALAQAKKTGAEKKEADDLAQEGKKAAEKAAEEWEKASRKIEDTLTDALMRGFESGKGFAQAMRDTVANMFKTLILRPTISAVMSPIAGVFGGGAAGAGGGNSLGLINTASNAYGLATAGASMASMGAANLVGAAGGDALGTLIAGNASTWGVSAAGVGGAAGAMGAIASALPIIGGVLAVASLIKSLDDSGTMHKGGAALASSVSGIKEVQAATIGFGLAAGDVSDKVVASSKKLAGSALSILQGIEGLTGKKSNWAVSTAFADDSSKDGAWGALRITRDDNKVLDWNDTRQSKWAPKEFADGEAGAKQYGDAVAAGIKQAIDTIELPKWAANIVKNLGDSPTLEEMSAAMAEIQAMPKKALQAIGTSSQSLSAIIMEGMRRGDPEGAGAAFAAQITYGIENSLYQGFSDQITSIVATDLVTPVVTAMASGATLTEAMATISIDTIKTKVQSAVAAFGAILSDPDIQTALSDLGQFVSQGISSSMANLPKAPKAPESYLNEPKADKDATNGSQAVRDVRESRLPDLKDQYTALQIERMRALGNAEEALAKEREIALAKLTDVAEREQQIKNWALQDEVDVIKERATLMARRNAATDTTAQALARERDAIKEVNRALFDSVVAAEKAKEVADERKGLQDELNGLTDTNAQALQRQRDALDESNRALFDQVTAARKAKEVADERKGIEDQWLQAIGAESVLRQRQLDALDPTNRSLQQMIYRLEDLRTASDKADQAVDKAYAVLEKSVNAQKEVLSKKLEADKKALQTQAETVEKSVNAISKVFDAIKSAIKTTTVETEALNRAARMSALDVLQSAVGQVQAGVSIDKITGLESALENIVKPSEQLYGRFDQYAKDQDKAADAMRQLEKHSGSQLSVAELTLEAMKGAADGLEQQYEQEVKALDATLEKWRESIDIQRGTYIGVQDVGTAIAQLTSALTGADLARQAATGYKSLSAYSTNQVVDAVDFVKAKAAQGDLMGMYKAAQDTKLTVDQVAAIIGMAGYTINSDDVRGWVATQGLTPLPEKFATGGAFTNGIVQRPTYFDLAQMGEAGAEAIMPLANIGGKLGVRAMGGNNAELAAAIAALLPWLESIADATGATATHTFNTRRATEDMVDRGVKVLPMSGSSYIKVEVVA
jgi:phage-related minor tail protein